MTCPEIHQREHKSDKLRADANGFLAPLSGSKCNASSFTTLSASMIYRADSDEKNQPGECRR
jgi:hypothetical protein